MFCVFNVLQNDWQGSGASSHWTGRSGAADHGHVEQDSDLKGQHIEEWREAWKVTERNQLPSRCLKDYFKTNFCSERKGKGYLLLLLLSTILRQHCLLFLLLKILNLGMMERLWKLSDLLHCKLFVSYLYLKVYIVSYYSLNYAIVLKW